MSKKQFYRNTSILSCILVLLAGGVATFAQDPEEERRRQATEINVSRGSGFGLGPGAIVSLELSLDGETVKGQPYSAEAVTEFIQTLADGNRILRSSSALVYRDGEGRTRREQIVTHIGGVTPASGSPRSIVINDPVSGTTYILNENNQTANKLQRTVLRRPPGSTATTTGGLPSVGRVISESIGAEVTARVLTETLGRVRQEAEKGGNVTTEPLGSQYIEGVLAEGTRTTVTIPAGQIGNELPILIVSERWYSPELKTVVMTKHSDPRSGENIFRLTNIIRIEPDPSLFQIPANYKINEPATTRMRPRPTPNRQEF